MTAKKVLLIGGAGLIGSACARLCAQRGHELFLLTRGAIEPDRTGSRALPASATLLRGDANDAASLRTALGQHHFDATVDFVAFSPAQVRTRIEALQDRTDQYVLISTASAYQTPPLLLPITESTPLRNELWDYGRDKALCEEVANHAYREQGFPTVIVRPSHTYDARAVPFEGGWTVVDRMRRGLEVVVHGDGASLWALTHHEDFAVGLVGLLGNPRVVGQAFHITTDEILSWNQIYETVAAAAGAEPRLVHIASDAIAAADTSQLTGHASFWGDILRGGKSHSLVFDNTKIKRAVPDFLARTSFAEGAREMIAWHDAEPDRRWVDDQYNALADRLIEAYRPRPL
jgi:nucleoside-diphosphate-sugar epimerase